MNKLLSTISRRNFLSGLFASVGFASFGFSMVRRVENQSPSPIKLEPVLNSPRYRRRKPTRFLISKLAPGFYLQKKSKAHVVHCVGTDNKIRGVYMIDEKNLEAWDPLRPGGRVGVVNRSIASYEFEKAALAALTAPNGRPEIACQLLLLAITQSLGEKPGEKRPKPLVRYVAGTRRRIRGQDNTQPLGVRIRGGLPTVQFRLYDLLAGLSVRFSVKFDENRTYLQYLVGLIESDLSLKEVFSKRLEKWTNPESLWHTRWSQNDFRWNNIKL